MSLGDLARRLASPAGLHVAGMLSGTSADGIDVGVARLRRVGEAWEVPELLAFETLPFPDELGRSLRGILQGAPLGLRGMALLHRDLGLAFAESLVAFRQARPALEVHLVGSHGQTVWHHDGAEVGPPASLQLGDPTRIAVASGLPVVSDFRAMDLALGGEGAPVSAYADDVIFGALPRPTVILNLGGIANLTWLGEDGSRLAFDTGPAGALLDGLARERLGEPFDAGGRIASQGQPDEGAVARILEHPSIGRRPPFSTGLDTFGPAWIRDLLRDLSGLGTPDLLASAAQAVARHVRSGLVHVGGSCSEVVVSGGGLYNSCLRSCLEAECGVPVVSSASRGVAPDAREALVFAVLAARAAVGLPSSEPSVTGARPGGILGNLTLPPAR